MEHKTETIGAALQFALEDGIAVLKMNRPEHRNSFSPEFHSEMKDALNEIANSNEARVLILTGCDGIFSAGGDLNGMRERLRHVEEGLIEPDAFRQRVYRLNDWVQALRHLEIPVIAAVDGPAYGGAFGLAMCADFVLCSERAKFCAAFAKIGAIPDCGLLFTLPRMVGVQRCKEIMTTGRVIDAGEAKRLGLALEVYSAETLMEEALIIGRRLLCASSVAFGITKRILNQAFELNAEGVLEMEASGQAISFSTQYHKDSVSRFLEKRPLHFQW